MTRKEKRLIPLSAALLAMSFAAPAFATSYTVSGTVTRITIMSSLMTYDDSFTLSDISSVGTCGTNTDGAVVFIIKKLTSTDPTGSRMFAIVHDDFYSFSKLVEVVVNDGSKDSRGFCYVSYMSEIPGPE